LPYNRIGGGERVLVVFQGLLLKNASLTGLGARFMLAPYQALADERTVYVVNRRPGLRKRSSTRDLADDYAATIREEFGGPVDVLGTSTGGAIAQEFAADHPDLVRSLILHASAYTLGPAAKAAQLRAARAAHERRWQAAAAELLSLMVPPGPWARPAVWMGSRVMALRAPRDPSDFIVTVLAEDAHDFRDRLAEIAAPTLVVAGSADRFYPEPSVRATAAGIPGALLILYEGKGHGVADRRFRRDVGAFLRSVP
jgi:pimeloyl-ACP methyl ester carboxylesterase